MWQFISILLFLAASQPLAVTLNSPGLLRADWDPALSENVIIDLCTEPYHKGICLQGIYKPLPTCFDLPFPFKRNLSTFAMEHQFVNCYLYTAPCGKHCDIPDYSAHCRRGPVKPFTGDDFQWQFDLSEGWPWNEHIESFACWPGLDESENQAEPY